MNISIEDFNNFQNDHERGIKAIFEKYYLVILSFAKRLTNNDQQAEDIAGGAFTALWENRKKIREASHIQPFLLIVTKNACFNYNRLQKKHVSPDDAGILYAEDYDIFEGLIKANLSKRVMEEITRLDDVCRQVITMLYIEGKSVSETALAMGITADKVSKKKYEGLQKLRAKFLAYEHEYWLLNLLFFIWFYLYLFINGSSLLAFLKK